MQVQQGLIWDLTRSILSGSISVWHISISKTIRVSLAYNGRARSVVTSSDFV